MAIAINDRRTVGFNASANIPANLNPSIKFTDGTGASQAKIVYQNILTLASGLLNVDLNGALADSYGSAVNLVRIKGIFLQNNSASNPMTFGAGTNPWATLLNATGTITLPAGAWILAATPDATGWGVTAGTGDVFKASGTGTDQFSIMLLGSAT